MDGKSLGNLLQFKRTPEVPKSLIIWKSLCGKKPPLLALLFFEKIKKAEQMLRKGFVFHAGFLLSGLNSWCIKFFGVLQLQWKLYACINMSLTYTCTHTHAHTLTHTPHNKAIDMDLNVRILLSTAWRLTFRLLITLILFFPA